MSTIVKKIILTSTLLLIRMLRMLLPPKHGCIFFAPDIPVSNLGDQALLIGAMEGLNHAGCAPIYVVANGPESIESVLGNIRFANEAILIQKWHLMFATERAFSETLQFYWLTKKVRSIVLVGADVLDGRYNPQEAGRKLSILKQCAELGLRVKVVGFSLSENVSEPSAYGFQQLADKASFVSRDPISKTRMQAYAPCSVGADCAFLMKAADINYLNDENLKEALYADRFKVALCLRDEDFLLADNRKDLAGFVEGLLASLRARGAYLLLIPHHPVDIKMLSAISERLNEQGFADFHFIDNLPKAQEIKAMVSQCEHVITSRMHVAIASLGMERAITCLPYAGKFEGLFEHFKLEGAALDRAQLSDAQYVEHFLTERFSNTQEIADKVKARLAHVKSLSQSNFDGL